MFEIEALPGVLELTAAADAGLIDAMRAAARCEAAIMARRLAAVAELFDRRLHAVDAAERQQWLIDGHEAVAAEVAAALGISRGRAAGAIRVATTLRDRLPKVAAVFADGRIDYRVVSAIVSRTWLVIEDADVAAIDAALAPQAARWGALSHAKVTDLVDRCVAAVDRLARRPARAADEGREVGIGRERHGMVELWGTLRAPDAIALDTRLRALADTVCPRDPRSRMQRRADATGALAAGHTALACLCGREDCAAIGAAPARRDVVITVLTDAAGAPGYVPGFGFLDGQSAAELAKAARTRFVAHPGAASAPEPRYRPSVALAEFVRCRDLTCRFPGCDAPAEVCDLDHTVAWPSGPTHPSNLKLLCRYHHLLKTFHTGLVGWSEVQLPDATVVWTSPTGHTYATTPTGALFFPVLAAPTGTLHLPSPPPRQPGRAVMMPTRARTRTQEQHARITWERNLNATHLAQQPQPPPASSPPF